MISFIGKFLTPIIVIILFLVIGIGLFSSEMALNTTALSSPLTAGLLEGYQTFDAMGAVVVGGVILVTLNLRGASSYEDKKAEIVRSGWIAGFGLFIIYVGLISVGAFYGSKLW